VLWCQHRGLVWIPKNHTQGCNVAAFLSLYAKCWPQHPTHVFHAVSHPHSWLCPHPMHCECWSAQSLCSLFISFKCTRWCGLSNEPLIVPVTKMTLALTSLTCLSPWESFTFMIVPAPNTVSEQKAHSVLCKHTEQRTGVSAPEVISYSVLDGMGGPLYMIYLSTLCQSTGILWWLPWRGASCQKVSDPTHKLVLWLLQGYNCRVALLCKVRFNLRPIY